MSCMNGCNGIENDNERNNGRNNGAECSRFFPRTIKGALERLVCECVILTFVNGCKEKVRIECITDDLVVVKENNCFRFISIDCICGVTASADTILDSLLGSRCD